MSSIKKHKIYLIILFIFITIFGLSFIYLRFGDFNTTTPSPAEPPLLLKEGTTTSTASNDDTSLTSQDGTTTSTTSNDDTSLTSQDGTTTSTASNDDTALTSQNGTTTSTTPDNISTKTDDNTPLPSGTPLNRGEETTTLIPDSKDNTPLTPLERGTDTPLSSNTTRYTLSVNNEEHNLNITSNQEITVYELMMLLSADSKKPFVFTAKEYPGMGYFVESINNTKNNPQENRYWIYYINEKPAQIGISQYIVKKGDVIQWKFEESKF